MRLWPMDMCDCRARGGGNAAASGAELTGSWGADAHWFSDQLPCERAAGAARAGRLSDGSGARRAVH